MRLGAAAVAMALGACGATRSPSRTVSLSETQKVENVCGALAARLASIAARTFNATPIPGDYTPRTRLAAIARGDRDSATVIRATARELQAAAATRSSTRSAVSSHLAMAERFDRYSSATAIGTPNAVIAHDRLLESATLAGRVEAACTPGGVPIPRSGCATRSMNYLVMQ